MSLRWLISVIGALSCSPKPLRDPAPIHAAAAPLVFPANAISPMKVTPLNHEGKPTPCVYDKVERPCDIEVTAAGDVYYRRYTPIVAGHIGPGLALRAAQTNKTVFALEPDGSLSGNGIFLPTDAARVLFCRLTDEPKLHCEHRFDPKILPRIWNQENCKYGFVLFVEGDAIKATFPAFPTAPPTIAARIDPPPTNAAAKGLALFLYAMEQVERDTTLHTPYVDHMDSKH
jgi:hypothetical protein